MDVIVDMHITSCKPSDSKAQILQHTLQAVTMNKLLVFRQCEHIIIKHHRNYGSF